MPFVGTEKQINPNFVFRGYDMSYDQVVSALAAAKSVKEAARMINVSYGTLKRYAKMYVDPITGKTLFEKFKNPSGKGVDRNYDKLVGHYSPEKLYRVGQTATPDRIAKLKQIIISTRVVPLLCNRCNFHERRLTDMKPPLLINFKNKNKSDWRKENLELLCYNCYFLYISDPIKAEAVKKIESYDYDNQVYEQELDTFHQMDEVYMQHLKSLGLDGEGDVVFQSNTEPEDLVDYKDDGEDLVDLL